MELLQSCAKPSIWWFPICTSSHCKAFEDSIPIDFIYGHQSSNELQRLDKMTGYQDSSPSNDPLWWQAPLWLKYALVRTYISWKHKIWESSFLHGLYPEVWSYDLCDISVKGSQFSPSLKAKRSQGCFISHIHNSEICSSIVVDRDTISHLFCITLFQGFSVEPSNFHC